MLPELNQYDRVRLLHMLEAARQAVSFVQGQTRDCLDQNVLIRRAVLHCVQEIGEAASRVSPDGRAFASSLPWNQIVGMRHRLVHVYFDVDLDLVWEVLVRDLPRLIPLIAAIVEE